MDRPKNGVQFSWHFLVCCLEIRHKIGHISDDDYWVLKRCISENKYPEDWRILRCFPAPFSEMQNEYGDYSLPTARKYWRRDHKEPDVMSPVYEVRIVSIRKFTDELTLLKVYTLNNKLKTGGRETYVSNCFNKDLAQADVWLIHGNVLVEPA